MVREIPPREEVFALLCDVMPEARRCGRGTSAIVESRFVIGASGNVEQVTIRAPFAGTEIGDCVARATMRGWVSPFRRERFTVNFPFSFR